LRDVEAVQASAVAKRFESTIALDGAGLRLATGEVRGLLGPNGAGKTTLLRILLGLIRPDTGTVHVLGHELDGLAPGALSGVAGFVEEPSFYPYLSGRANLRLLARLDGNRAAELEPALQRVGLAARAEDRVSGYSTGMRQRLGLAASWLRSPRLLLLDEPTSGLDPAGARAVASLVRELAAEGVAVLLSSHQIGELEQVCDSYTFLREGRVVWDGTAGELEAQAPQSAFALHTLDDARAFELARQQQGLRVQRVPRGGLAVAGRAGAVDALVLALGDERIVIRRLEQLVSPLESMFFALTEAGDADALSELEPQQLYETIAARG
jgi:ABC-2 type transport system ATP-binding protein